MTVDNYTKMTDAVVNIINTYHMGKSSGGGSVIKEDIAFSPDMEVKVKAKTNRQ